MNISKLKNSIWEIVGLATGILFFIGILAMLGGIGYGIYQYARHHVGGIAVEPGKDKSWSDLKLTVQYELPLPVDDIDYFIIPVSLEKKKQGEEREFVRRETVNQSVSMDYSSSSASGSYSSYWGPFYNLVFVNKKTGAAQPLLNQKAYIDGVYFPEKKQGEKAAEKKPAFILLEIATADTNHDGIINGKDAVLGFVAGLDGTNLTQVTPDNTQMGWWRYDALSQSLFVEVVRDANQDRKFNWDDPKSLVSVNVSDPKMGQEFIPEEVKSKIETLLKK
jgi:hypothetical protein